MAGNPRQIPRRSMRHHGRNWPTNINTPGVHSFQQAPRAAGIYEEQEYLRSGVYAGPRR